MSVWFTSDLHIGHRFIAGLRWNQCSELTGVPTVDPRNCGDYVTKWHDEALADSIDERVKPDDVVYNLGDISGGSTRAQENALQWISERPGRWRLIAGNHDRVHPMYRDHHEWQPKYLEVFESVAPYGRLRCAQKEGHTDLLMCHFPYVDKFTGIGNTDRYTQYRLPDEGLGLIHGHTHSLSKLSTTRDTWGGPYDHFPNQLHVGVDAWDLAPVPLSAIVSHFQGYAGVNVSLER